MESKHEYLVKEQAEPGWWWIEVRLHGTEEWSFVGKVPLHFLQETIDSDRKYRHAQHLRDEASKG